MIEQPDHERREDEEGGGFAGQATGDVRSGQKPLTVVGIGASAGGLAALQGLFDALPSDTGMAFVVVTHMDPDKESLLPELLQKHTAMPVRQVRDLVLIEPDHVYVIPPGQRILVTDSHLDTEQYEERRGWRTPIDFFFRSLASTHRNCVAIVLSGGGTDGAVGIKAVKEQGGLLMVQHPDEAEHDSMPRAAISTGLADVVLPVAQLAEKLTSYHKNGPSVPEDPRALTAEESEYIYRILAQVQVHTGHDFSQYKRSTILRRIQRRMQLHGLATLGAYLEYLRHTKDEAQALFADLLIGVTNFFRDREAWQALEEQVIPRLFEGKEQGETIRVWSIGCATGEEAYSLAILLTEYAASLELPPALRPNLQVFASDLDDGALSRAREGIYPEAIEADVSPERLQRFFQKEGNHYRLRREVRDIVLFSNHSVLRDPPFSRLDLISCRNLLIYLNRELQANVFQIFHYALSPECYLFLGSSESADGVHQLFNIVDKRARLYQVRPLRGEQPRVPSLPLTVPRLAHREPHHAAGGSQVMSSQAPAGVTAGLHRELLEEMAPPSVLVDEQHHILHISDSAGRYLRHPGGVITSSLLQLVRPELQPELRSMLARVQEQGKTVVSRSVAVQFNGSTRLVTLAVRPYSSPSESHRTESEEQLMLIFFLEDEVAEIPSAVDPGAGKGKADEAYRDALTEQLAAEVQSLREQLQITTEQYETSNEELKAANEELQSINEEYRSTTEELETSKEELQSVNEELQTVNAELKNKLEEVSLAHSDLENLMAATDVATLFLDRELRIQRYTPGLAELFNVMPGDRGRPIDHLTNRLDYEDLSKDANRVLRTLVPVEREVQDKSDRWFLATLRPYRTVDDRISGVVLTFVEISELKETENALRKSEARYRELAESLEERVRERTEQVRKLSSALSLAEQAERDRIAHILHDNLQQQLYAVQVQLTLLDSAYESEGEGAFGAQLKEIENTLREAIATTRELNVDLSPPILHNEGLTEAIGWLAEQMRDQHHLQVTVEAEESFPMANEGLRVLLFQAVRELLFNVIKHAGTNEAGVRLEHADSQVRITVYDQGQGFDREEVEANAHSASGLATLRKRLSLVGGELDIETVPGDGARVSIVAPLKLEAE
jgi:two-component system CheB/CheR fusion protein